MLEAARAEAERRTIQLGGDAPPRPELWLRSAECIVGWRLAYERARAQSRRLVWIEIMPVRIYDISKKLGLENKEVIAKAKALGHCRRQGRLQLAR